MVSSRQGKRVSKAAGSRSLHGFLDLGGSRDQLCLVISRAVEVTQSALKKRLWPEGWWGLKIWAPPPPSPLRALLLLLQALSLLGSTALPKHSEHAHATWSGVVTKGPTLVETRRCPFTMCLPSLILCSCRISYHLPCLLINTTQFTPSKSSRVYTN